MLGQLEPVRASSESGGGLTCGQTDNGIDKRTDAFVRACVCVHQFGEGERCSMHVPARQCNYDIGVSHQEPRELGTQLGRSSDKRISFVTRAGEGGRGLGNGASDTCMRGVKAQQTQAECHRGGLLPADMKTVVRIVPLVASSATQQHNQQHGERGALERVLMCDAAMRCQIILARESHLGGLSPPDMKTVVRIVPLDLSSATSMEVGARRRRCMLRCMAWRGMGVNLHGCLHGGGNLHGTVHAKSAERGQGRALSSARRDARQCNYDYWMRHHERGVPGDLAASANLGSVVSSSVRSCLPGACLLGGACRWCCACNACRFDTCRSAAEAAG
eukprot:359544-Chlamydomonas_euryale.AAC.7